MQVLEIYQAKLRFIDRSHSKADNQGFSQRRRDSWKGAQANRAGDLHDTVSQEIFCCPYDFIRTQSTSFQIRQREDADTTQSVTAILETAQRDLRILLLHLRPIELEQKSLVEGIQLLLKELEEKVNSK